MPITIFSGSCAMEVVIEEHPRLQIEPAVDSGFLRLSPHGLWIGYGTYTSPIIDLGEIYEFSGLSWIANEAFNTSVDTTVGGVKTLEVRYHDYQPPELDIEGNPWNDQHLSSLTDPQWGSDGSIPWIEFQNDLPISGVMIRYVQWRATLRGA